ncbi:hypothetical protein OQA88_10554 [Cercophora sp. LCS_1]
MIVPIGKHRYLLEVSGLVLWAVQLLKPHPVPSDRAQPVILLSKDDCSLEPVGIPALIRDWYDQDDVFDEAFLSDTLLILDDSHSGDVAMVLRTELAGDSHGVSWPLKNVYHVTAPMQQKKVPSGPYVLKNGLVYGAWKVYTDESACFQTTVLLDRRHGRYWFKNLDSIGPDGTGMSVAVPSRRYASPCPASPLAGLRVAIKDNFKLAGTRSAVGNRSFLETYHADKETAAFIKKVIERGARVVGKTKMTAFASGEKPCDWFDFQCPFNVRGDGHLEPGASSTGSATAIAAYPWLDVCVGTDTNGSVREPAARCGVYGIRYSTDSWGSNSGLYPCCPEFDSVGAFARDLKDLRTFVEATLSSPTASKTLPKEILYPTEFFPHGDSVQQGLIDNFVVILEEFLGVKKTNFTLAERWAADPPIEAQGKSLAEYAYKTGYNPFYYDILHQYDGFRDDHNKRFGAEPYVSPSMQWRWDRGAEISVDEVQQSLKELKVLQSWFAKNVLRADESSSSSAILILPVGATEPNYRDVFIDPTPRLGVDALSLASFMKMPQLVVPSRL